MNKKQRRGLAIYLAMIIILLTANAYGDSNIIQYLLAILWAAFVSIYAGRMLISEESEDDQ